jgi:hypothetical protein
MVDQRLSGKQNVSINGTGLEWTTVTSGIPQRSVPGSIFFLQFTSMFLFRDMINFIFSHFMLRVGSVT